MVPSPEFIKWYGPDFSLMFRISAKQGIVEAEIRGPTVYRKDKDVEFTIFLPFDIISGQGDKMRFAMIHLLQGVVTVFELLKIDTSKLLERQETLINSICTDHSMIE